MPMTERYYVTNAGLAAALRDDHVRRDVEAVLRGEASVELVKRLMDHGWLDIDRRPGQVDNNLLILSGAVSRLREIAPTNGGVAAKAPSPAPVDVPTPAATHENSELVEDLRTLPRKLYRLRADRPVTKDHLRKLPSGARRVYAALQRSDVGTTRSLADLTGLNRRTVENSLGSLRKAGLLEDFDYTR